MCASNFGAAMLIGYPMDSISVPNAALQNYTETFSMLTAPGAQAHTDIAYYPLMAYNSIIFRAIHFALYARPKRLLLFDCAYAAKGYFNNASQPAFVSNIQIPVDRQISEGEEFFAYPLY